MDACKIVQDLLPIYVEELTSEETNQFVEKHLKECEKCKCIYNHLLEPIPQEESHIEYKEGLERDIRKISRDTMWKVVGIVAVVALVIVGVLCHQGVFWIVERKMSPDKSMTATVYSVVLSREVSSNSGFTIRTSGVFEGTTIYRDCEFRDMWWSKDSKKLVISMENEEEIFLAMHNYDQNSASNLDTSIRIVLRGDEFKDFPVEKMDYEFVQWADEGYVMLIQFFYEEGGERHSGYFWFDYENGTVSGIAELYPN